MTRLQQPAFRRDKRMGPRRSRAVVVPTRDLLARYGRPVNVTAEEWRAFHDYHLNLHTHAEIAARQGVSRATARRRTVDAERKVLEAFRQYPNGWPTQVTAEQFTSWSISRENLLAVLNETPSVEVAAARLAVSVARVRAAMNEHAVQTIVTTRYE